MVASRTMRPTSLRSLLPRRLALAIVGAPLVVAALLLLGELACRIATPAGSPHAPVRYLELRAAVPGGEPAALVPGPRPPFANARFWPTAIPMEKPAGATRVLFLGDSTVHGHPFEP